MRAVWVTQVYPREPGDPLGGFLHRLARELPDRGVEVDVVAPGAPGAAAEDVRDGVRIHRFETGGPGRPAFAYTGEMHRAALRAPWAFAGFLRDFGRAVAATVERTPGAIVHAHWWAPPGWLARGVAVRHERPFVVSLHGTDVRLIGAIPGARVAARHVLRSAGLVLPVSAWLAEGIAGLPRSGAIEILPMPADADRFRPSDHPPVRNRFGIVARLTSQKRVDLALRAVAELSARGRDVELWIAGDGPERADLQRLARELAVEDRVRFEGVRAPEEVAELLAGTATLVLPARREGYGLVVREAALCSVPAIVADSGALPDLVEDGTTGWVVGGETPAAWADALDAAYADPEETARRGRTARERALGVTAGPIADRLVDLYRGLSRP